MRMRSMGETWSKRLAFLLLMALASCQQQCGGAPPAGGGDASQVVIHAAGATHVVTVELARAAAERARGLMYRQSLPEDHGMLFVFDGPSQDAFWMKNTYLPLDLLFLAADGAVVDLKERATPQSEALLQSSQPYYYVLEVNGGYAAAHGIRIGDRVEFQF